MFWQREDKEAVLQQEELRTSRERTHLYQGLAKSKTDNHELDEMVRLSLLLLGANK
jgi:hypothetical protein